MELLTERYAEEISGVISCFDRVVIRGALKSFSYAGAMTSYLKRIFPNKNS